MNKNDPIVAPLPASGARRPGASVREPALARLVDPEILQRLQDWFVDTCGLGLELRDEHGQLATRPCYQNVFCKAVMGSPHGETLARAHFLKALRKATRNREVIRYALLPNVVVVAAPIYLESRCVGAVLMSAQSGVALTPRQVVQLADEIGLTSAALKAALDAGQTVDLAVFLRAVDTLPFVAHTISWLCVHGAEALEKLHQIETLHKVSRLLTSTLDLRKVLKLVARSAVEVSGAKGCSMRLLNPRTRRLEMKSHYNLSRRYLGKGDVPLRESPIDQAAIRKGFVQIPDMLSDPRVLYPKEAAEEGIRSGISVALMFKRRPVGTLHLYTAEQHTFDADEIRVLKSLANQAAVAIHNAQLYAQAQEKRKLDRELRVAGVIQTQLLPHRPPRLTGFDLAAASHPCSDVGGDFYDFIPTREGGMALAIADVAGKGVPGALLMASARAALRAYVERTSSPRDLMERLNVFLCHDTHSMHFVSLFCGVLDPHTRAFIYTNAGHNPPILMRQGRLTSLDAGGLVLGAEETARYEQAAVQLRRGDVILFYTDGVTEALNVEGQVFGVERLNQRMLAGADLGASALIKRVCNAVRLHTKGEEQSDDITLVALRVL